ncbi:hypothetical protein ACIRS1_35400 [Kitasatospora sp. NPDC101176]|uniref:hypothetical protein n=1 Tax=Kitasatospora sp. NPDC101176 TaxID=3364099 RepID=UPI0038257EDF
MSQGQGICRTCAGNDPRAAETAFRARVAELGGEVLEPAWTNTKTPHRVRCREGHVNAPRPDGVLQGQGICRTCAGNDPRAAETAFRARVAELGGEVLEPAWLGSATPHRIRCKEGHHSSPRPRDVASGQGICRACAGRDPRVAEAAFRARVAELGGEVLEPAWLGADSPHRIRCGEGHENAPHPNAVANGQGICRTCAGRDPRAAEAAFRARTAELGGEVLEPAWLGSATPHRIRCKEGHHSSPRPNDVTRGRGICRICAGRSWDAFYVVVDDAGDRIKFGITSGDPRPRLGNHARDGFERVVRLLTELPESFAPDLEREVKAVLARAGIEPVRGREYFDRSSAEAVILDVVDHHPDPAPAEQSAAPAAAEPS